MNFLGQSGAVVVLCVLGAVGAVAQVSKAAVPEFEVAVIKPSQLGQGTGNLSMGIKVSARQVSIKTLTLQGLIEIAYKVKSYQVQDPAGLLSVRDLKNPGIFDIEAKLPEGATAAQVPVMLQSLLADRFKLKLRRDSKQMDILALTVGKNGPTFQRKESTGDTDSFSAQNFEANIDMSKGGGQIGGAKIGPSPGGGVRMEIPNLNGLTEILISMMEPLPVIDKTGLQGTFEIVMDLPGFDNGALNAAIKKLGLVLEKQKDQIEMIVVEQINRVPSEN